MPQTELDKIHHGKEITSATFVLVARGGPCSFTTKVRNVEEAGASLAIIIDTNEEDIEMVNMQDDGAGAGIRIPSMIISRSDGQKILEYIIKEQKKELDQKKKEDDDDDKEEEEEEKEEEKPKKQKIVEGKEYGEGTLKFLATFNMTAPDNHVEYMIWMSSSNDKALDFIEDFKQYETRFGDQVTMTPHYNFWACKDNCEKKFTDKHCFGAGKYCAADTNHKTLTGKDIIMEDLREICIY